MISKSHAGTKLAVYVCKQIRNRNTIIFPRAPNVPITIPGTSVNGVQTRLLNDAVLKKGIPFIQKPVLPAPSGVEITPPNTEERKIGS